MTCPHCQIAIHEGPTPKPLADIRYVDRQPFDWVTYHQICPECSKDLIWISRRLLVIGQKASVHKEEKYLVWPRKVIKNPPKQQVLLLVGDACKHYFGIL